MTTSLPSSVDVAIVGAGPAGLATALSLIKQRPDFADRLVVIERASFPREKICAGGLGARADRVLASIDATVDVPSVPVHALCVSLSAGKRTARSEQPIGRVVRRSEFDHALASTARAKGIRIVEGARVHGLRRDADRSIVECSLGEFRTRVVVGADGVGSVVRRALGLPGTILHAQAVEVDTDPCDRDEPRDVLVFESLNRKLTGYTWDFPTLVQGEEKVCRGAYVLQLGTTAPDAGEALNDHLRARDLAPREYRHRRFAERGYVRSLRYARPGWLLVGEAAGIDSVTGEGIPQALMYGELAGRYLAECFEARDLRFENWSDRVASTFFGWDLRVREQLASMFYGRDRPWLERLLIERPWFLQAGIEYFAGRRIPRAWLGQVGLFGLRLWVGAQLSR